MNQAALALKMPASEPVDRTGFDIGWDHAHHGLVPTAELLLTGTPVCEGWLAGKAVFGRRTLSSSRYVRMWLQLRLLAWRCGSSFDTLQVTPNYLSQIDRTHCPVRRCSLGGAAGHPDAARVVRLNPQAGFSAGNLAMMSAQAADALNQVDARQAMRLAHVAETGACAVQGLDAAGWQRIAALRAFTTPMPFAEAARLPLAVLPPNRVRLLNATQGLQALVTQLFTAPGWSVRCRALADLLPAHTVRHDFNLFVGAMAPRVLEASNKPGALRLALEDAWLLERVQRRWQHLVLSLGETATAELLQRALQTSGMRPPGLRIVQHAPAQATEGGLLPMPMPMPLPMPVPVPMPMPTTTPNSVAPSSRARGPLALRPARGLSAPARPAGRPGTAAPPAAPPPRV